MCADGEVEDARHYVCRCPNALYGQVRKAWYLKVKEKLRGISMELWEVFVDTVVLKNGMLANGEGKGANGLLKAWDAISGRIHIYGQKRRQEKGLMTRSTRNSWDGMGSRYAKTFGDRCGWSGQERWHR